MQRSIINSRFMVTGWAIFNYIPRAFTAPKINGLDFFKADHIKDFVKRVEQLRPDTQRQWGTMEPEQMLHHLNLAVGSGVGFADLPDESYFLSRTLFRWILVDWFNEQPVGLRLPLNFVIAPNQHFDFAAEQQQLVKTINKAGKMTASKEWEPHPMFGKMSQAEWGKLLTIHIDYHLRQFGLLICAKTKQHKHRVNLSK